MSAPPCSRKIEVGGIGGVALCFPLAIGRGHRVDLLGDRLRKIELAGDEVPLVDEHLEVDMRRAARIPAGIDRGEAHLSAGLVNCVPRKNVSPSVEPVSWRA